MRRCLLAVVLSLPIGLLANLAVLTTTHAASCADSYSTYGYLEVCGHDGAYEASQIASGITLGTTSVTGSLIGPAGPDSPSNCSGDTVTVDWGDHTTSSPTIDAGCNVLINGSHSYTAVGEYYVTMTVSMNATYTVPSLEQVCFWPAPYGGCYGYTTETVYTDHTVSQSATGTANIYVTKVDTTAPTTAATPSGTLGNNGWYRSNVSVSLFATDPDDTASQIAYTLDGVSGAISGYSGSVAVNGEGRHTLTYAATDGNGNTETTKSLAVDIDETGPAVSANYPAPASTGWYNASTGAPTITFNCSDPTLADGTAGSGVQPGACPGGWTPQDGANQTATVSASDIAGNPTSFTTDPVNVDLRPPTTTLATPLTDWYSQSATVALNASDNGPSGVAATYYTIDGGTVQTYSAPFTISTDGRHSVQFWSTDNAGNVETPTTVSVNVDSVAPTVTHTLDKSPASTGWYSSATGAPTASFTCSDPNLPDGAAGSGVKNCPAPYTFPEGGNQTYSTTASDNAGNVATDSVGPVSVDLTAPTIAASATTADGNAYTAGTWTNQTVTVHFTCSDAGSGVATCPADQSLNSDTTAAGVTVSGSATDNAGNSSDTASFGPIMVDKTPPTLTHSLPAPSSTGWYNASTGAPTATWTCGDALSGLAGSCPAPYTFPEGASVGTTVSVSDNAGNTATDTISGLKVDLTAPAVSYSGNAGSYTVDQTVSITCSASDPLNASNGTPGSGVASSTCTSINLPASTLFANPGAYGGTLDSTGTVASFTLLANATDVAGNTGPTASTSFTVKLTSSSLQTLVIQLIPNSTTSAPLITSLQAAQQSASRGNYTAAANQVGAFLNKLQAALNSGKISQSTYDTLTALGNALRNVYKQDTST